MKKTDHPLKRLTLFYILLSLMATLSTGCKSNVYMASKTNYPHFDGGSRKVYVTNPEMRREYEILKKSEIYQLSDLPDGARHLTLHPIHQYGRCANPLLLTIITCGIVPGVLPGGYVFEYDMQTDGKIETQTHLLPLYERFSIYEWLMVSNEQKKFAEALAYSSLRPQLNHP